MDAVSYIGRLSSVFAPKENRPLFLDNFAFQMHYKFAFAFLMASTFILTGNLWVGKPATCMTEKLKDKEAFESYCLVHGFHTYHAITDNPTYRPEEAYPGVGPYSKHTDEYQMKRHDLYMWTVGIFVLMALGNYFPHFIWKISEGGRLNLLVQELDSRYIITYDESRYQENKAARWFKKSRGRTNWYMLMFILCEMMNVINCVIQMYIIHVIFDHQMWTHQIEVIQDVFTTNRSSKLLQHLFPKAVKCNMPIYGIAGSKEVHDAICHLHQNHYTQVAFVLLWIWYFSAGTITLLYVVVTRGRFLNMKERFNRLFWKCPIANKEDIDIISQKMSISDMFLLDHFCSMIQPYHIEPLLKELASNLRTETTNTECSPNFVAVGRV